MCAPETAGAGVPSTDSYQRLAEVKRYTALCGIEPPNQPHLTLRLSAAIEGAFRWCSMLPGWPRRGSIQRAGGRHSGQAN